MNEIQLLTEIESCIDCKTCMDYCDTFIVTQDDLKSPNGRLKITKKVFKNESITEEEKIGLYTCTLCGICDRFCTENINISDLIHSSKIKLVNQNEAPLEIHNKIIKNIIEKDNSVNGNPEERLYWIPNSFREQELYESKESDTLLFLGCMSSFRVKESASSSYKLLKAGNFDFKILEKEPCCGEYVYSAGNLELAKQIFEENFKLFKEIGVKNILVTCGGCLYAFNNIYPKYVSDWNINVKHIIQIVNILTKDGKLQFNNLNNNITYHDSCRMGRKLKNLKIFEEPRELLKMINTKVEELNENREYTPCCGAGSGIRGVDSSISIKIGSKIFQELKTKDIITSCPLCVFNYRYVNYKTQSEKTCRYITDYLLEALDK
ncbi:MAG: (Fe-S)-binding protein [Candidatus Heimdallarchaeota archaeon]